MSCHPVTEKIKELLSREKCWFEIFEHQPVKTSEEAAKVRPGYSIKQGAKAMIIGIKAGGEKKFVMLVLPGNLRFDNDKVKILLRAKDIRFATEKEIFSLTGGVKTGGIPPFGNLFNLEVVADSKLFKNEKIIFNAGSREVSVTIKSKDYQRLVKPKISDISKSE